MVMPFGKHRGSPVAEVPVPCPRWVLKNDDMSLYPGLRPAIRAILAINTPGLPNATKSADCYITWVKQQVNQCYREVALLYHPDRRGGSTEAMVAINATFERLRRSLELE
jgi:hypothetical protein